MTSYSKALFNRNPGAAKELRKAQLHQLRYGKDVTLAQFHYTPEPAPEFGRRKPTGLQACAANCGHPACKNGCTLLGAH